MTEPPPRTAESSADGKKVNRRLIWVGCGIIAFSVIVVPLFVLVVIMPWIAEPSFTGVEDIKLDELEEVYVQLLNHPDRQPDIDKTRLAPADFEKVLAPLRGARPVNVRPSGAFLGEFQIRYKDGRRGTIRLRFEDSAAAGNRALAPVWFEVGSKRYVSMTPLGPFWQTVQDCVSRGTAG